jgi:PKD repeat protein
MKKYLLFALMLSGLMTSAQTFITDGNCRAAFKYAVDTSVKSLLPATAIQFHDRSEGKVRAWYWDFGDGNTSTEQNPMFVFNHPVGGPNVKINPYRTVSLTILTTDTCKSFYSEVINILDGTSYNKPLTKAWFKYYQTAYDSIGKTASFQLTNISEGDSLQYLWQFGNGKTSTEKEPTVTFDFSRTEWKVCLTVTGADKVTDTFCDAVYIIDPNKPVIDPAYCETNFGFTVNHKVMTFAPALVLDFYSKAWPEPVEWKWDFGDGTTSNEPNPMHIFNFPILKDSTISLPNPFRTVTLTVKTATGCIAKASQTINIYMEQLPVDTVPKCQAMFKYERATDLITIPEVAAFRFYDVSESKVKSRLWQFEDGKTSTEENPLVTFDIFKSTQKVCLTIYTEDGCESTFCQPVYVSNFPVDTVYEKPVRYYTMKIESTFPPQMSSCAGWAKAQVYMKDSLIQAKYYKWSDGTEGQEVKGLCPTNTYSVKAIAPDGAYVSTTFVFNSDGTITEIPVNWTVSGSRDNLIVQVEKNYPDYTVEWRLCDGSVARGDSIPLALINCGSNSSNLILKDASGKEVYSENISMKTIATKLNPELELPEVKLFPNPVRDVLNIQYSGKRLNEMQVEISDISGKRVSVQKLFGVESGQQIGLNVSELKKGIYFCKFVSDAKVIGIQKFSK